MAWWVPFDASRTIRRDSIQCRDCVALNEITCGSFEIRKGSSTISVLEISGT